VQEHFNKRDQSDQPIRLGIHTHNDADCAVANALLALSLGVDQVQGTMNGYGERCGNANLVSIIPAAVLKMGLTCEAGRRLDKLYAASRLVNARANQPQNRYQPYVGESAFAHKGGVHVSAVQRNPLTYEHIEPEKVGNLRRVLVSDQSGRSNVLHKAKQYGIFLKKDDPVLGDIIRQLKDLEKDGYQYEGADASFELLMRRAMGLARRFFEVEGFRVINYKHDMKQPPLTEATIRLFVGGEEVHTAAMGNGPVNALDQALRKALQGIYPRLGEMELADFRVRVLSGEQGTGAKVRVLIDSRDEERQWTTVGVSENIIEASWQALVDAITFKLLKDEEDAKVSREGKA
jgi:2-isopropylmalate synthase